MADPSGFIMICMADGGSGGSSKTSDKFHSTIKKSIISVIKSFIAASTDGSISTVSKCIAESTLKLTSTSSINSFFYREVTTSIEMSAICTSGKIANGVSKVEGTRLIGAALTIFNVCSDIHTYGNTKKGIGRALIDGFVGGGLLVAGALDHQYYR
jgi:hypothetical protein